MGIALACIHISYEDFCKLDFEEFAAIYNAYVHQRDFDYKDQWERARLVAYMCILPHINRKKVRNPTPKKVIPLPWDKERPKANAVPKLTPEQQRRRFEQLVKKLGDKI